MQTFLDTYSRLHAGNLELLRTIYDPDVTFVDPAHEIQGLERLTQYFTALYAGVDNIGFTFHHPLQQDGDGYVQWRMTFTHPRIAGGGRISVDGASYLQFGGDGLVLLHRDYFDLGAMLYEHLPILGRAVTLIKRRLGT